MGGRKVKAGMAALFVDLYESSGSSDPVRCGVVG